jgi:B-cell receptor-associated protein 31
MTQPFLLFRFVGILFADALQRMYRITTESELAKATGNGAIDVRAETNLHARKF